MAVTAIRLHQKLVRFSKNAAILLTKTCPDPFLNSHWIQRQTRSSASSYERDSARRAPVPNNGLIGISACSSHRGRHRAIRLGRILIQPIAPGDRYLDVKNIPTW